MIGTGDDARSRRAYRQFVQKGLDGFDTFNLKEEVRAKAVWGSEDFREWLRDRFLSGAERKLAERPAARALMIRFRFFSFTDHGRIAGITQVVIEIVAAFETFKAISPG
jgi:hypothetical protein